MIYTCTCNSSGNDPLEACMYVCVYMCMYVTYKDEETNSSGLAFGNHSSIIKLPCFWGACWSFPKWGILDANVASQKTRCIELLFPPFLWRTRIEIKMYCLWWACLDLWWASWRRRDPCQELITAYGYWRIRAVLKCRFSEVHVDNVVLVRSEDEAQCYTRFL